jgi:menaquinone-9 beta-reductase
VFDLVVIGGGPAGSAAAIAAAKAGVRVLLLERGRLPRQRVCGEFVSAESLSLLTSLLPEGSSLIAGASRIGKGRLFVDGRVISTDINPAAASIARWDLDEALWHSAIHQGVEARLQSTVEKVEGVGPFQVCTSSGLVEAKAVLNATGRWSNLSADVRTQDNFGKKWLGVKAHFEERDPSLSVDLYFFEGGYCGVQPTSLLSDDAEAKCRINACAMVQADVAGNLREVFEKHPGLKQRSSGWIPLMDPVSTSPLVFREPKAIRNGVFQAGDAAGFVDPFVGDGISLALRSGAAAARWITGFLAGEISRTEAETEYEREYRQDLLPIFRNSARLRRLLRLPRVVRGPIAGILENTPALAKYLVRATR